MTVLEEDVRRWMCAVQNDPDTYRLDAYGPWLTVEETARYFATWAADEATGAASPALCRRCGNRLTSTQPGQQLHPTCIPRTPWRPWTGPSCDA